MLPNVASIALKDMSHLTCFTSDKKNHYATKCLKPKKNRDTLEDQKHLKRLVTSLDKLRVDEININST